MCKSKLNPMCKILISDVVLIECYTFNMKQILAFSKRRNNNNMYQNSKDIKVCIWNESQCIKDFLEVNKILFDFQCGFRRPHSTILASI